jgi:hypothetical protein
VLGLYGMAASLLRHQAADRRARHGLTAGTGVSSSVLELAGSEKAMTYSRQRSRGTSLLSRHWSPRPCSSHVIYPYWHRNARLSSSSARTGDQSQWYRRCCGCR